MNFYWTLGVIMVLSLIFVAVSNYFEKRAAKKANEKALGNDPRDLYEPEPGVPDPVVVDRIKRSVDFLQEHLEFPTLIAYEYFLMREITWVTREKDSRRTLAKSGL